MPNFTVTLTGVAPLLMHSANLADPISPASKALSEVTSKRGKTEADHLEMMTQEFLGGLYWHPDTGPYIPAANIWKCAVEGARKNNKGKQVEAGVFMTTIMNPLKYDGPREPEEMLADARFVDRVAVTVQRVKVMRTRPKFTNWSLTAEGQFNDEVINFDTLDMAFTKAGSLIGIGDRRPMYGRFQHELVLS